MASEPKHSALCDGAQSFRHADEPDELGAVTFRVSATSGVGELGDISVGEVVDGAFAAQALAEGGDGDREALLRRHAFKIVD